MTISSVVAAPVSAAPTAAPSARATTSSASLAVVTKNSKKTKKAKKTKRAKRIRAALRVSIKGAPRGQVSVRGPRTVVSVTQSAKLRLRLGRYRLKAAAVTVNGDLYKPSRRGWKVTVRKGDAKTVVVNYKHIGSSAPGRAAVDPPPPGELGKVLTLVNDVRSRPQVCGTTSMPAANPLRYNAQIARAAQLHADDMAANDYFEHESLDGSTFVDRIRNTNYKGSPAGENIAMGFQTAEDVVAGWLTSPGHCRNLMDPDFDEMGMGYATRQDPRYSEPATYWVQNFGYAA